MDTQRPAPTETDRLHALTRDNADREAITALWRTAFAMPRWWFLPAGPEGQVAPAAAEIEGAMMLLGFSSSERARHFAVEQGMLDPEEPADLLAREPRDVVLGAADFMTAGIQGLVMDVHLSGWFAPFEQLGPMWRLATGESVTQD
ncbi:hypothetical protein SAMN05445756_0438 [Kytococcus aerolatus]|uniref:SseB protein N-terminal domain-containing protein n=1 Tax=Kytococcus aerolatus TaxID=592308 RepID=A0A212T5E1_9MICO|nr:hypothetical protein [Kytococcus aerolatus]SNC61225.1 hypothetical protein SAMN05445756_0438 [Kytococcus aerolatus]